MPLPQLYVLLPGIGKHWNLGLLFNDLKIQQKLEKLKLDFENTLL